MGPIQPWLYGYQKFKRNVLLCDFIHDRIHAAQFGKAASVLECYAIAWKILLPPTTEHFMVHLKAV